MNEDVMSMPEIKVADIGLPVLNEALMGGVPRGYTILLGGSPGSGMELFAKQFAAAGIGKEKVVYFTTTERDEDILTTMREFNWPTDMKIVNIGQEYYTKVLEKELLISRYRQEGVPLEYILESSSRGVGEREVNFLTRVTYEVSNLTPPFRIVLDSLDFFLEHYEHSKVLSALRTIKAHTQYNESVSLVTMLTNVYSTATQSGVEEIVDIIIELEMQRKERGFEKYLVVKKVRNHPEKTGVFKYYVNSTGIRLERIE